MFLSTLFTASVALSVLPAVLGHPGMGAQLAEILSRQANDGNGPDEFDSVELLGDLVTLPDNSLTTVGANIKQLLLGNGNPQSTDFYTSVPGAKSAACAKDTCCVWKYVADDMVKAFRGKSGRCSKWARAAVRLGFHDAGGWSKGTASLGGGADGSIILNSTELTLSENKGLQDIATKVQGWYDKWHTEKGFTAITMADMIQWSATVATVVCPLGPRIRSFVGRHDSFIQNPRLLPDPNQPADFLIELFQNKTINPHGLTALVGSHTTSQQFFVNTTRAGDPQDSTPGVWDVLFYAQTQGSVQSPKRVFMFNSDVALSKHAKTQTEWQEFAGSGGQDHWNEV